MALALCVNVFQQGYLCGREGCSDGAAAGLQVTGGSCCWLALWLLCCTTVTMLYVIATQQLVKSQPLTTGMLSL
jgi:hypothetical protein